MHIRQLEPITLIDLRIEEKIEELKVSKRKAAKLIGCSHTTLHRVLKGETPDVATLEKIATWLDVDIVITRPYFKADPS